jgi:carbamoylphosphate synthase large subunit
MESLDYNYLRGKSIDKKRFQEALDELGIELPESIPGYKYI